MRFWKRKTRGRELEGFAYAVPGPGGEGEMWIARSVTGQIAHGRTPEGAVERLRACLEALALAEGLTPQKWRRAQRQTRQVLEESDLKDAKWSGPLTPPAAEEEK